MARTGAERVHVRNRFGVRAPLHRHDVTTQVANGYILERASRENGEGKKGKKGATIHIPICQTTTKIWTISCVQSKF